MPAIATDSFAVPRVPALCSRPVGLQMMWASASVPPSVIPSSAWYYATPIAGSPFDINVLPRERDVRHANSFDAEGFSPALAKVKDRPHATHAKVCTASHARVRYCSCSDLSNVKILGDLGLLPQRQLDFVFRILLTIGIAS